MYSQTVRWTTIREGEQNISVGNSLTLGEAQESAFRWAIQLGWTPPKWWQFWRWGDTKLPPGLKLDDSDDAPGQRYQSVVGKGRNRTVCKWNR